MEKHKINIDKSNPPSLDDNHLTYFGKAMAFAQNNYQEEIDRISKTSFDNLDCRTFFREYVWCVYTSGFNAKVVSKFYDHVMVAYSGLQAFACNDTSVTPNTALITVEALKYCNNKRKVLSIIKMAEMLRAGCEEYGWNDYKELFLSSPEKLAKLPFVGKITCFHLARNIGLLNHVKPDLHLVRLADNWGFPSPDALCKDIAKHYMLPLGIIDLILWYSASTFGTKI